MKKFTAVLFMFATLGAVPATLTPVAGAEVCAAAGGRHFAAGGCTHFAGDAAAVAIVSQDHPYADAGEIPCYTAEGVPYFTPPGYPC
jgi:hypothetical protein